MAGRLTIRLDDELAQNLERVCRLTGRSRSEIAREAIRRTVRDDEIDDLRAQLIPYAEAHGWVTDEDVFRDVS